MKTIEALKQIDYKDVVERSLWTFAQGFLSVVILGIDPIIDMLFNGDWNGLYVAGLALLLGAIAAGLSALKTIILETVRTIRGNASK